jgi:hypothetical protein
MAAFDYRSLISSCIIGWLICISASKLSAQWPQPVWQKTLGGGGRHCVPVRMVAVSADSALIIAANVSDTGHEKAVDTDGQLYKISSKGQLIWQQSPGQPGSIDRITDLALGPEYSLYFVGSTGGSGFRAEMGSGVGSADNWVGHLSRFGTLRWQHTSGGSQADRLYSVVAQGPIVAGGSWSTDQDLASANTTGSVCAQLIEIESLTGNIRTVDCLPVSGTISSVAAAGEHSSDLYCAVLRHATFPGTTIYRISNRKWVQWQLFLGRGSYIHRMIGLKNGNVAAVGHITDNNYHKVCYLLELSPDGKIVYEKSFGAALFQTLTGISECSDGGLIVCGYAETQQLLQLLDRGKKDAWIYRLDVSRRWIWQHTVGGPENEVGVDITELGRGVFFLLAEREEKNQRVCWLVRIEEHSCQDLKAEIGGAVRTEKIALNQPFKLLNVSQVPVVYPPIDWKWDLGDGNTSKEAHPVYKYTIPGRYQIRLIGQHNLSCVVSDSVTIEVGLP